MSAYVLTDEALTKHAGRFVWLFIDVDKVVNGAFLEKFKVSSLPTLLVLDSEAEHVVLQWLGSATVPQIESLLADAELAIGGSGAGPVEEALAKADRLNGERKYEEAAFEFERVLHLSDPGWPRRPRVVESLVFALDGAGDMEKCADIALVEGPSLPRGPSFANVVSTGLYCALEGPDGEAWPDQKLPGLEALVQESLTVDGILADDRSGHYSLLAETRERAGDEAGVRAVAEAWMTFLEAEVARAPNPEARAAFDSHRLMAAMKLGDPGRVLPALEASERDLPDDYNPPARLAIAYLEAGHYAEALAAAERALAKVYGPRKLRVYIQKAEILVAMERSEEARKTLMDALEFADTLPPAQRSEGTLKRIHAELEGLEP